MIIGVLADTQSRHLETQANLLSHIYNNKLQSAVINETESLAQLLSLIKWMNWEGEGNRITGIIRKLILEEMCDMFTIRFLNKQYNLH
jgi:hypothetical protein